jgi:hypothetical protein
VCLQIESLTDYLLVSQEKMLITYFRRAAKKDWLLRLYEEPREIMKLVSIDCELTLEQV